ncbi:MAG: hypothetical protein HYV63_03380 [Candidatus Schekmanbacteria bacterium]|nr:hypothetical protein [Candidatus Schekmanbacteria bacterium]
MVDVWDDVPEAKEFCESIARNIEQHKAFAHEELEHFTLGILASTAVDAHHEAFSLGALEQAERTINSGELWMNVMHDPLIQPGGRAIGAKVFYSPRTDTHILAGVAGVYKVEKLPTFADVGITADILAAAESAVQLEPDDKDKVPPLTLGFSPQEIDESVIIDALAHTPPELDIRAERHFRKALDPLTIVSLCASVSFFLRGVSYVLKTPLAEECQRELGKQLVKWLKEHVFPKLFQKKRTLFEFVAEHNGCRVQLVTPAEKPGVLAEAADHAMDGIRSAVAMLDAFKHLEFKKLIYEWDENTKRWYPLHAATAKAGVISNRPQLIAMEQMKGFSLAGSANVEYVASSSDPPSENREPR